MKSKKSGVIEISDFYSCETHYLLNEMMNEFKEDNETPMQIFSKIIDFLYEDEFPLNYAAKMSDEVKGHFTKMAYKEYKKYIRINHQDFLKILRKERLGTLYKEYYEATLSLDTYNNKGKKIRKEIEDLKALLEED